MLVKLPKEIGRIMVKLTDAGFESYIVGGCVRDSILGKKPYDWDLTTNAKVDNLKELFPEARVLSEKFGVVRLEYIEEATDNEGNIIGETGIIADIATYRKEGEYQNGRPTEIIFADTIEEDLPRRDFTINAIADSHTKFIDMFEGREDIRKRLIKTVGDADKRFKEDPLRMMRAVRLAAELDFDLHKSVYDAIIVNRNLLENVSIGKIRDEFVKLVTAEYAGKGLKMLLNMDLLHIIIGKDVEEHLSRREKQDLIALSEGIDKSKQVEERRLGLFFSCINKKRALPVIEKMNFDEVTRQYLIDAVSDLPKLYFTSTKPMLKKFIYERGWERYHYLANLEKAQRIVFDYDSETKIKSKMYLLQEIKSLKEPIFPEDLVIDANDLIEAGICSEDKTEKILGMLTEEIHTHPHKNNRKELLKLAKTYSKNKLAAALRGIHWSR